MHIPLIFQPKVLPHCVAYPQINLCTFFLKNQHNHCHFFSHTYLHHVSHSSSFAIIPTPPTPSPFPDHHNLHPFLSISSTHTPLTLDLHMGTVATLTSLYNVPLLTSVDVVPLMKTAGVVENSGQCIYSIGLKCF